MKKKLTLAAVAAAIFATSIAAPIAAPISPAAAAWSDTGSANEWTWALVRDGATLDAHLQRYQPAQLPIFDAIADIAEPVQPQG